jgi:NAD(P)-dependent dehydrogenase (short-subunit alcohol dehydrogenase family)
MNLTVERRSPSATVLITGASSGIGLEFAKQYAAQGWNVIATHRHASTPPALAAAAAQSARIRPEQLDVTAASQAQALAEKLAGAPIDVLINNAAVAYDENMSLDTQEFGKLSFPLFDRIFATNVRGPLIVTEALHTNVKAGTERKVVCMSSTNGSLTQPLPGSSGTFYRASKAALNRAMMNVAEALRGDGISVVLFHPGAVLTEKNVRFGQPYPGMISTEFSVRHMISTISRLGPHDTGRFLRYDGEELPW